MVMGAQAQWEVEVGGERCRELPLTGLNRQVLKAGLAVQCQAEPARLPAGSSSWVWRAPAGELSAKWGWALWGSASEARLGVLLLTHLPCQCTFLSICG